MAALLVNLCTLIGILTFFPSSIIGRKLSISSIERVLHIMIPSFACGALAATALFLMIPEAIHLISGHHDEEENDHRRLENSENEVAWKFGASVLGGYFIPFVFAGLIPHSHVPNDTDAIHRSQTEPSSIHQKSTSDKLKGDNEYSSDHVGRPFEDIPQVAGNSSEALTLDTDKTRSRISPDYRLCCTILIGDGFHNFSDGVFIGAAFLLCSNSIAIAATASTVFHELSQEIADYILLTSVCGLSPLMALALNFVSGLSVMVGVVVVLSMDLSDESVGILLCLSAGVYFYITFTECAPRINHFLVDSFTRMLSFTFWVIGIVPIGLVLLSHEHCH